MDPGDNDGGGGAVRERGVKQLHWYGSHFHFLNGFFSLLCFALDHNYGVIVAPFPKLVFGFGCLPPVFRFGEM